MAIYTLNFNGIINPSIQIGDKVYSAGAISNSGNMTYSFDVTDDDSGDSNLTEIGTVIQITDNGDSYVIKIENSDNSELTLNSTLFIFFSKNNAANKSSIKGYYNSVQFTNDSTTKAELFATSFAVSESSK